MADMTDAQVQSFRPDGFCWKRRGNSVCILEEDHEPPCGWEIDEDEAATEAREREFGRACADCASAIGDGFGEYRIVPMHGELCMRCAGFYDEYGRPEHPMCRLTMVDLTGLDRDERMIEEVPDGQIGSEKKS